MTKVIDVRWADRADLNLPNNPSWYTTLQDVVALELFNTDSFRCAELGPNKVVFDPLYFPALHWSRVIEIPWAVEFSDLYERDDVLEVGGSGATFQFLMANRCKSYTNVDKTFKYVDDARKCKLHQLTGKQVRLVVDDLRCFTHFHRQQYDKIISISVVEHDTNPPELIQLMWSKLKSGGRLLLTMDVADRLGEDHHVDIIVLQTIAKELCFEIPPQVEYTGVVSTKDGKGSVNLKVLMVCLEKE